MATTVQLGTQTGLRARAEQIAQRIQFHAIPLAVVLAAILFGQYALFHHHPISLLFTGDSTDYLNFAHQMATSGHVIDAGRTPVYPALLVVIFAIAGDQNYGAVVFVQALLFISSIFMVYLLAFRLGNARWMAAVVAVLMATNTYMLNWEREILTESLAIWLVVLTFVMLERYLRTGRRGYFVALTALSIISVFNRPFFIYLPALLMALLVVQSLRAGQLRAQWRRYALAFLVAYGMVFAYAVGNKIENHYFGFTYVSSINLFGKVMEYRMQNDFSDPQYAELGQRLNTFIHTSNNAVSRDPFTFLNHRYSVYEQHYYAFVSGYSQDIIIHNPVKYSRASLHDTLLAVSDPQIYYDNKHPDPRWFTPVLSVVSAALASYYLLPIILVAALLWWWRAKDAPLTLLLVALALTQAASLLEIGFTSYAYPYRLRVPLDWSMLLMAGVGLLMGAQALLARMRAQQTGGNAEAADPDVAHVATQELPVMLRPTKKLDRSLRPTHILRPIPAKVAASAQPLDEDKPPEGFAG